MSPKKPRDLAGDARRDAVAALTRTFIFIAAKELIGGVAGPVRIVLLWLLAAYPVAWASARPSATYGVRLDGRASIMLGLAVAACAAAAAIRVIDPMHGLLAAGPVDAALVGALVFAAALATWGTAAVSIRALTGNAAIGSISAGVLFTMAFFTGSVPADTAILAAGVAASVAARLTRSIAFPLVVVAFGFAGVPGAAVAVAGFLLLGLRGTEAGTR